VYFNWRGFLADTRHALFPRHAPELRITGRRARALAMFYFCMAWMGGSGRLGLLLDRLLFPRAARTSVDAPIFIVGNFRSGSTLLHRLLAADPQFTAMKTWEIYFAPSVSQRKFWHGFWIVDSWFGSPVRRRIQATADRTFGEVRMHRVDLAEPEEDEALLLYLWESLFNWFFMPRHAEASPYWQFDRKVPRWRRDLIMRFYHGCLRRHIYTHPGATYISKNPSFSAKLESLLTEFPDARIIYLVRHPEDTIVSTAGWFSFAWHYFADPASDYPFVDTIVQMVHDWYTQPLALLDALPPERYRIVRYEDLVESPRATVTGLLAHFGYGVSAPTHVQLADLEAMPDPPRSHDVRLASIGLDPARVADSFSDVMERFGYEA
jgi:hypothetical protein